MHTGRKDVRMRAGTNNPDLAVVMVKFSVVTVALEPEWEAKFERNSYGFRPQNSTKSPSFNTVNYLVYLIGEDPPHPLPLFGAVHASPGLPHVRRLVEVFQVDPAAHETPLAVAPVCDVTCDPQRRMHVHTHVQETHTIGCVTSAATENRQKICAPTSWQKRK